jgi:hypothetical protein
LLFKNRWRSESVASGVSFCFEGVRDEEATYDVMTTLNCSLSVAVSSRSVPVEEVDASTTEEEEGRADKAGSRA